MAAELSGTTHSKQKSNTNNNQEFKFPPKVYFFQDEQVVAIFYLLHKSNKLKLLKARRANKVGRTTDPNYYLFHKIVHLPTNRCYVLKDKIQVLIDARVLTLKLAQKKVTANMVILNFGTFPKMTVQDGLVLIPKEDWISSTLWLNSRKQKASSRSRQSLKKSCGSTQILSKISNGKPTSPSSKESHAMPSPSR